MNRFIIEYDLFKNDIEKYLLNIRKIASNRSIIHIIINNAPIEFLTELQESNIYLNNRVFLYNNVINITNEKYVNKNTYLLSVDPTNESKEILTEFYKQRVVGYSALKPFLNSLVEIKNDDKMYIYNTDIHLGNLVNGVDYKPYMYQNNYIGLNGKCSICLNCLCDIYKEEYGLPFKMVNNDECRQKNIIYNNIPKEIKEVTQEQFIYLIESMNEVNNNVDIITAKIFTEKEGK